MYANIDHDFAYTFSMLAGAAVVYTFSYKEEYVWTVLLLVVLYSPFHELLIGWFGFPIEDTSTHQVKRTSSLIFKNNIMVELSTCCLEKAK